MRQAAANAKDTPIGHVGHQTPPFLLRVCKKRASGLIPHWGSELAFVSSSEKEWRWNAKEGFSEGK